MTSCAVFITVLPYTICIVLSILMWFFAITVIFPFSSHFRFFDRTIHYGYEAFPAGSSLVLSWFVPNLTVISNEI